jgi:hypothetical protein
MTNAIIWGKKELIKSEQSSWYDHYYYIVPYTGIFNASAIKNALRNSNKFGFSQYVSVGGIIDLGDGKMEVEKICKLGD